MPESYLRPVAVIFVIAYILALTSHAVPTAGTQLVSSAAKLPSELRARIFGQLLNQPHISLETLTNLRAVDRHARRLISLRSIWYHRLRSNCNLPNNQHFVKAWTESNELLIDDFLQTDQNNRCYSFLFKSFSMFPQNVGTFRSLQFICSEPTEKHLALLAIILRAIHATEHLRLQLKSLTLGPVHSIQPFVGFLWKSAGRNNNAYKMSFFLYKSLMVDLLSLDANVRPRWEEFHISYQFIRSIFTGPWMNPLRSMNEPSAEILLDLWWHWLLGQTTLRSLRITHLAHDSQISPTVRLGLATLLNNLRKTGSESSQFHPYLETFELSWMDNSLLLSQSDGLHPLGLAHSVAEIIKYHKSTLKTLIVDGQGSTAILVWLGKYLAEFQQLEWFHFAGGMPRLNLNGSTSVPLLDRVVFENMLSMPRLKHVMIPVADYEQLNVMREALGGTVYQFELTAPCFSTPEDVLIAWRLRMPQLNCVPNDAQSVFDKSDWRSWYLQYASFTNSGGVATVELSGYELTDLINEKTVHEFSDLKSLTVDRICLDGFKDFLKVLNRLRGLESLQLMFVMHDDEVWSDNDLLPILMKDEILNLSLEFAAGEMLKPLNLLPMLYGMKRKRPMEQLEVEINLDSFDERQKATLVRALPDAIRASGVLQCRIYIGDEKLF